MSTSSVCCAKASAVEGSSKEGISMAQMGAAPSHTKVLGMVNPGIKTCSLVIGFDFPLLFVCGAVVWGRGGEGGLDRECGGYTNPWRRRVGEDWLWLVATVSSKWLTLGPLWRHYVTTFSKNSLNKWTLAALHHLIKWLSAVLLASKSTKCQGHFEQIFFWIMYF